jgi:DNA-binding CsgD family transcriptional regulator
MRLATYQDLVTKETSPFHLWTGGNILCEREYRRRKLILTDNLHEDAVSRVNCLGCQLRLECAKWDWSLQDVVLADKYGYSRERIRHLRILLKKPKAVRHHSRRDARFSVKLRELTADIWGAKTNKELATELGCAAGTVATYRSQMGQVPSPCRKRSLYRWENVDWNLPYREISNLLGCSPGTVQVRRNRILRKLGHTEDLRKLSRSEKRSVATTLNSVQE